MIFKPSTEGYLMLQSFSSTENENLKQPTKIWHLIYRLSIHHSIPHCHLSNDQEKKENLEYCSRISSTTSATEVCFQLVHLFSKWGKPLTSDRLAKLDMIAVDKEMYLEKIKLFKSISLSMKMVAWKLE